MTPNAPPKSKFEDLDYNYIDPPEEQEKEELYDLEESDEVEEDDV